MKFGLLNKGDTVLFANDRFIAIKRKNGEVDLIPIFFNDVGMPLIDENKITTITYGNNTTEMNIKTDSGNEITITTF